MNTTGIKYGVIIGLLISPLFWYLPALIVLSPNPCYDNLSSLNYAPIHNRSVNVYRDIMWLDNESWDFRVEGAATWQSGIPVPSSWNFISGLEFYEGVGYYQRTFNLTQNWVNKSVFLHFRGVNYYCEATLNGFYLGSHEGGYTPFKFNVTGLLNFNSLNTLVVKVSNVLSSRTVPGQLIGWKNYGGIYREVYLEASNQTFVESNFISHDLQLGNPTNVTLTHNITFFNSEEFAREINCSIQLLNQSLMEVNSISQSFILSPISAENVLIQQTATDINPWSPESPHLYYVNVSIFINGTTQQLDKMTYRVGFKKVEINSTTLFLNGEPFLIKGINRHEDFPGWGKTQPYHLLQQDLAFLKDLNVNSIRTFHYPNHPAFLEMCDEHGILIIEEIPAWNIPASDLAKTEVIDTAKQQIREMIQRDFNHPCILFWGVGNEIASNQPEGLHFIAEMVQTIKELDPKTPTYFASNKLEDDISFGLVDIIASNPKYGWYYGDIQDLDGFLEYWHQKYPNKPVLITEFSAGSQLGDFSGQKFSENYQAKLLQESWDIIISKNYTIGAYVSCFMDYPDLDRMLNPTPFFNQKGLLSYDRTYVKLAFNATKGMFNETPYLFPVTVNPNSYYPLPTISDLILVLGFSFGFLSLMGYSLYRNRKFHTGGKAQTDFNKKKKAPNLDMAFYIVGFCGLILSLNLLIYTFLKTTTFSFPVFDIEEKIIIRFLITDGIYLFVPYLLIYYFVLTSLLEWGLARLLKVKSRFEPTFLTHIKSSVLFNIGMIFLIFTFAGIMYSLIVFLAFAFIKIIADGWELRKSLGVSRKIAASLKVFSLFIMLGIILIYLEVRFDLLNRLSLLF